MLTVQQLLEMMEVVSEVPSRIKALPHDELVPAVAFNATLLSRMIRSDLDTLQTYLEDLDKHLLEVEHAPDSRCWERRAEAVAARHLLLDKLEQTARVIAAVQQMLNSNSAGMN